MVTATVGPSAQASEAPDAFPKTGSGVRSVQEWTVSSAAGAQLFLQPLHVSTKVNIHVFHQQHKQQEGTVSETEKSRFVYLVHRCLVSSWVFASCIYLLVLLSLCQYWFIE